MEPTPSPRTPPKNESTDPMRHDGPTDTAISPEIEAIRKSWRAPLFMLLSLLTAFGIASAHHLMGTYLNSTPVADVSVSQAWISRFSTALSFLVKMTLAICVGTAYMQHQWMRLQQRPFRTEDVDALTSVLGNAFSFISSTVWARHPLLTIIAFVSWGIPLATISAPGSLTVLPISVDSIIPSQHVPQPQFNATNFGNQAVGGGKDLHVEPRIYKLAYRTASAGQPVPITPRHPNETYHLDFFGPAVKCAASTNESLLYNISVELCKGSQGGWVNQYLAWAEPADTMSKYGYGYGDGDLEPQIATLDRVSTDASRITIVTSTGKWNVTRNWTEAYESTGHTTQRKAIQVNITECALHNATYHVDFTFQYPGQALEFSVSDWSNTIAASTIPEGIYDASISYLTVMDAFGKMLVGRSTWNHLWW